MNSIQKIAQCFSPAAFIHDSEENYQSIEKLICEQEIGGLTFFHSRHSAAANFEKRAEVLDVSGTLEKMITLINRYQAISKIPLLISIDGEYGLAMRIEKTPQYPFAITLGAIKKNAAELIEEVGYSMGLDMKQAGIHLNLAPCSDVNTNPNNPVIGYRSFGTDPQKIAELSLAMYRGMKKAGIGACFKHFPGHGDTQTDSHLGLPVIQKTKEELKKEELLPFQYGIANGVEMIMVGHLAAPALSRGKEIAASISREIITDLLKTEMGFKGLVISDALNMKAVADLFSEPGELEWEAFHAGNDILCFSDHVKEGIEAINEHASEEEIEAVFEKVWALKEKLGVFDFKQLVVPEFNWESHAKFQSQLAKEYVSIVSGKINSAELQKLAGEGKLAYRTFFHSETKTFTHKLEAIFSQNLEEVEINQAEKVIISVFVPSHKPLNQFGMDETTLAEIKKLKLAKSCILFHFGNPLAIKYLGNLDEFEAVICEYQGFEESQEAAVKFFK
ncbi:glycoside hydrolase family 3 N-terminal domain-containing protein [Algoriphagus sp. D3-2-R+10]|uniref:glycoside hydrolase family 3 protein n=1 Tax=Algoriphagus aurantiacus TaxID=3103948 RepID=UPI002B3E044F|nr:glycoside hydrolase family 3 N-terminal domain-containing protein [Algoriphagus sp. D3-2-R+10]MEB2775955.1 glycoside hydrolase family 3 N-terminal domain-containing protein [Algoriphagus sp. D3-2-R+10]